LIYLQRNLVTKIKRDSIKTYFYERTAGGPRATSFYPTIKPFLSGKTKRIPMYYKPNST
jgi:hypothetical protein